MLARSGWLRASICGAIVAGFVGCGGAAQTAAGPGEGPGGAPGGEGGGTAPPAGLELALGSGHLCVRVGGRVMCRGRNTSGQLGDGTRTPQSALVTVEGIEDARSIAVGDASSCAVRTGGTVSCWGKIGELGHWPSPTLVPGLGEATSIAIRASEVCALSLEGVVTCRSDSQRRRMDLPPVRRVALGYFHACALLSDGGVRCWGENHRGLIAEGDEYLVPDPLAIEGIADAVAIDADYAQTCVVFQTGGVRCWGSGAVDVPPSIDDATDVAVGSSHVCVVRRGGNASCFGHGEGGQLGDGGLAARASPVSPRDIPNGVTMHAAGNTTCAVGDGRAWCWGASVDFGGPWPPSRPVPAVLALEPVAGGLEPAPSTIASPAAPGEAPLPPATAGLRLRGADAHGASGLVARAHGLSVLVVTSDTAAIEVDLPSGPPGGLLDEIARISGLGHRTWGRGQSAIHVLAPTALLDEVEGRGVPGLAGGQRTQLHLHRGEAGRAIQVLADDADLELEGSLGGTVTVHLHDVPARGALGAILRLAKADARLSGRRLVVSAGSLPSDGAGASRCGSNGRGVHLACAGAWDFTLGGTVHDGRQQAWGLLYAGGTLAATVRRGDYAGQVEVVASGGREALPVSLNWRVEGVSDEAMVLSREDPRAPGAPPLLLRLALGAAAPQPPAVF